MSFFAQVKLLEFFFHTVIDLVITIFVVWADIWREWLGKLTWLGFAVIYKDTKKVANATPYNLGGAQVKNSKKINARRQLSIF